MNAARVKRDEDVYRAYDRISHECRFKIWNLNRSFLATGRPLATPWYDVDLIEFYYELPRKIRASKFLLKVAGLYYYPKLFSIPVRTGGLGRNFVDELVSGQHLGDVIAVLDEDNPVQDMYDCRRLAHLAKERRDIAYWFILAATRLVQICKCFSAVTRGEYGTFRNT